LVKVPIVRLYYPSGGEVLLGGVNICHKALVSFSYKYVEGGADKGNLVLRFNKQFPFSLQLFRPGNFYGIRWGYIGNLSKVRTIAIDTVAPSVDRSGYTLKLVIVPAIAYKDKGDGDWNSVSEALEFLDGMSIVYEYYDTEKTHVKVITTNKNGKPHAASFVQQKLYEQKYKPTPLPEDTRLGLAAMPSNVGGPPYDPYAGFPVPRNPKEAFEALWGRTREYIGQRITTLITTFLEVYLKGQLLSSRDKALSIAPPDLDSTAWFTFTVGGDNQSSQIISCGISKSKTSGKAPAHIVATMNPTTKEVGIISSITSENPWDIQSAYSINTLPDSTEYVVPAIAFAGQGDTDKVFEYVLRNNELYLRDESGRESVADSDVVDKFNVQEDYARKQNYIQGSTPLEDARLQEGEYSMKRSPAATEEASANIHQLYLKKTQGINKDNIVGITSQVTMPYTLDEALSRVKGIELADFFNTLQGTVLIEGLPLLEIGFNFNIQGLGDLADGKFHSTSCTHTIQGGKYTTAILGGKIPKVYKRKESAIIQTITDAYTKRVEESRQQAADELNSRFDNKFLLEVSSENIDKEIKVLWPGRWERRIKAQEDNIPEHTSVVPSPLTQEILK